MQKTGYTIQREDKLFFSGVKQAKWTANERHAKIYLDEKAVKQALEHFHEQGLVCYVATKKYYDRPSRKKKGPIKKTGVIFHEPVTTRTVAAYIVAKLKAKGFVVFRYNARSSDSVYLKIDHGMGKSIRISDHPGMSHLNYRYNVISTCTEMETVIVDESFERHYYGHVQEHIDAMIQTIIDVKNAQISKYNRASYERLMAKNYQENSTKQGFWTNSWQA